MKVYELDIFDDDGMHLATVLVYGQNDDEIDAKLDEISGKLASLDDCMDNELAFAETSSCDEDEMPDIEDWTESDNDEDAAAAEGE